MIRSAPIVPAYPTSIVPESAMLIVSRKAISTIAASPIQRTGIDGRRPSPPRQPIQIIRTSR